MPKKINIVSERNRLISGAKKALDELNKIINQDIDLEELDVEKAKIATQGKIEAIQGFDRVLSIIEQQQILVENELNEASGNKSSFSGVENMSK